MGKFIRRAWPLLLAALLLMGRVPGTLALVMERTAPVVNTFRPDESVEVYATVTFRMENVLLDPDGRPLLPMGFRVVLEDDTTGEVRTALSDQNGRASFTLTFHPEDVGVHTFRLYVEDGERPGVVYSDRVYELCVVVSMDDGLTTDLYLDGEKADRIDVPFLHFMETTPDVPDTGDRAPVHLYAALMLLSAAGLLALQLWADKDQNRLLYRN